MIPRPSEVSACRCFRPISVMRGFCGNLKPLRCRYSIEVSTLACQVGGTGSNPVTCLICPVSLIGRTGGSQPSDMRFEPATGYLLRKYSWV